MRVEKVVLVVNGKFRPETGLSTPEYRHLPSDIRRQCNFGTVGRLRTGSATINPGTNFEIIINPTIAQTIANWSDLIQRLDTCRAT